MTVHDNNSGACLPPVPAAQPTSSRRVGELVGARLAGRFCVERRLGEGGMGVVYEAYDEQRGERVAVKTLGRFDAEAIYRLKSEFRSIADLVHPNLVRLHELFSEDDLWFFTMERIHGVPFIRAVREDGGLSQNDTEPYDRSDAGALEPSASAVGSDGEVRQDVLRASLAQLMAGVRAIHGAGKLHRDLKPSNVLVGADGRLTILDFGLVTPAAPDGTRSLESTAGTPAYMAPEQLSAGGACVSSDWYAVGLMLFEALTGRWPFTRNVHELLSAKLTGRTPPDPRDLCASAPADLAELAKALLAPRPSDRPGPEHVAAVLGAGEVSLPRSASYERRCAALVGREDELARLRTAFEAVRRGAPRIVSIAGASGIGKTALVERFLDEVRSTLAPDALILSGRCYERESVPFKALDAAIDSLSRHLRTLDPVASAQLTPRDVPDLCRVFPVLARVPTLASAMAGRAPAADADAVRRRAFSALRELFARLADKVPLIVTIDDLQWGDVDSGHFLTRLVAPPDPPRILLIGAYRSNDAEASPMLALLDEFARRDGSGQLSTIELRPLVAESALQLAAQLLEGRNEPERARLAESIAADSGGSPFFIGELARANFGALQSQSLAAVIASRVAALAPDARALLEVVSVAGAPVPRDAALRAAGLEIAADAAIPVLRAESLLLSTGERLETYHDRIRESIVAALGPDRRRSIHGALADALASEPSPPIEALALHTREAGRREDALRFGVRAADRAAAALAFDRAASLYEDALELAPNDGSSVRHELGRKLADALRDAGKGRRAAEIYMQLSADARGDEAVDLERSAAHALLACGEIDLGIAQMRRVMSRIGFWVPRSPLVAFFLSVLLLLYIYLREADWASGPPAEVDEPSRRRLEIAQSFATALGMTEIMHGFYVAARTTVGALAMGDPVVVSAALLNACWTIVLVRPRDSRIAARLSRMRLLVESHSHPKLAPLEALATGVVAFFSGRWREARDALERAESGFLVCSDVFLELNGTRAFRIWSLFYCGEVRVLSERVPAFVAEARARGDLLALNVAASSLGPVAWLAKDDIETASREADESFARWPGQTFDLQHYWYLVARGLVDLYSGDGSRLHAQYERDWPALRFSGILSGKICSQQLFWFRAGAAIECALATSDPTSSRKLVAAAERHAKRVARNPVRGSEPLAAVLLAAIARARSDLDGAGGHLASAVAAFDALDMRAFAAAAKRQLGRLRGGDDGGKLIAEADAFMASEGITKPTHFAAMLAPGFPR